MNPNISTEIRELMNVADLQPSLSIILPFETKISLKTETAHALKVAADRAETLLLQDYTADQSQLVMHKLKKLINDLVIPVGKTGVAIYVSPQVARVIFLDGLTKEKIIVGDSFDIRDLVYSATKTRKYLLLLLSGKESHIYQGDSFSIIPFPSNLPESISPYVNDAPERVANFSDVTDRKQVIIDKFLYHIDEQLGELLEENQLPVLVLGSEKILGHFKKLTKHAALVMDYVQGNYEEATTTQLMELIQPNLKEWENKQQQELLIRLDEAAGQKRLAIGIMDVWKEAANSKGQLLVVEETYQFAAQQGPSPEIIEATDESSDQFSIIRDAVGKVIEKVLESGGDVAFVADDNLKKYHHIALISYY